MSQLIGQGLGVNQRYIFTVILVHFRGQLIIKDANCARVFLPQHVRAHAPTWSRARTCACLIASAHMRSAPGRSRRACARLGPML